jgi:hypothetical protein
MNGVFGFNGSRSGGGIGITPVNDLLLWSSNKYVAYSSQQSFLSFDTNAVDPTLTTRLNLNGNFHATNFYTPNKIGIGNTSALAPIHYGNNVTPVSTSITQEPGIMVRHNYLAGLTTNPHSFVDASIFSRPGYAIASFDCAVNIDGSGSYGHLAAHKSVPIFTGGGTTATLYNFYSGMNIANGTNVTTVYNNYVGYATGGTGNVTTNYGYYCVELNVGTARWAVYTAGTTKSYFGGTIGIGNNTVADLTNLLTLGKAGTLAGTLAIAHGTTGYVTFNTTNTNPTGTIRLNIEGSVYVTSLNVINKLTVGGLIDPTGLVLTAQASHPNATDIHTLWEKTDGNLFYGVGTLVRTKNTISGAGTADLERNSSVFANTSSGSAWNGTLLTVGGVNIGSYPLQINASYNSKNLSFRSYNEDTSTWGAWSEIYHSDNLIFSNGITKTGTSVKYGGLLTGNTTIDANDNIHNFYQKRIISGANFLNTGAYPPSPNLGLVIVNEIYKTAAGKYMAVGVFTSYNGNTYCGAIKFTANKTPDSTYSIGTGFYNGTDNGYVNGVIEDTSGNLYYTGLFTSYNGTSINRIVKTDVNGVIDATFTTNVGTGFDTLTNNVSIQSDNKIIVTGPFTSYKGNTRYCIARLNSDGTDDAANFNPGGSGFNTTTYGSLVDIDGKIYVWGVFHQYVTSGGTTTSNHFIKLTSGGLVDLSFASKFDGDVIWAALQTVGATKYIVAVGDFTNYDGTTCNRIVRFNANTGAIDATFAANVGTGSSQRLNHVLILPDNSIIATGEVISFNGNTVGRIIKLDSTGTFVSSFSSGVGLDATGFHLLLDGVNIMVVGSFASYNGTLANKIATITQAGALYVLPDVYQKFSSDGTAFGDTIGGNYAQFEPDGTLLLVGDATVYDDLQFTISAGKVSAANYPTWEAFTTNTKEYSFAVNDFIDLSSNEPSHGWLEGSLGDVHLHITTKAANTTGSARYAKFQVIIAYANVNGTWTEIPFTAELTILDGTVTLTHYLLDMGDLTLTGYNIGMQLKANVKRIAATGGTEYSGNIFINQCGIHMIQNKLGSRTETSN